MVKRTIKAKDIVNDIRCGVSDTRLMNKYRSFSEGASKCLHETG